MVPAGNRTQGLCKNRSLGAIFPFLLLAVPGFDVGAGGRGASAGPHACVMNTVPTDLCPHPLLFLRVAQLALHSNPPAYQGL